MCDEYDDERMRVFWRQLAMQEGHAQLEAEPEGESQPVVLPTIELRELKPAKPQARAR